jgi:hypothetical protein
VITEEELNQALDDMFVFCTSGTLKKVRCRKLSEHDAEIAKKEYERGYNDGKRGKSSDMVSVFKDAANTHRFPRGES